MSLSLWKLLWSKEILAVTLSVLISPVRLRVRKSIFVVNDSVLFSNDQPNANSKDLLTFIKAILSKRLHFNHIFVTEGSIFVTTAAKKHTFFDSYFYVAWIVKMSNVKRGKFSRNLSWYTWKEKKGRGISDFLNLP